MIVLPDGKLWTDRLAFCLVEAIHAAYTPWWKRARTDCTEAMTAA